MADIGFVNIQSEVWDHDIYLWTHETGSQLQEILRAALKRGELRWRDPGPLSRIILNEMTKGEEMSITGFGITNHYASGVGFVVDVDKGTVNFDDKVIPFAEFIKDSAD